MYYILLWRLVEEVGKRFGEILIRGPSMSYLYHLYVHFCEQGIPFTIKY
jgi:hypothetical protein